MGRPSTIPVDEVVAMHEKGISIEEIAMHVGCNKRTIYFVFKRAGINLRPNAPMPVISEPPPRHQAIHHTCDCVYQRSCRQALRSLQPVHCEDTDFTPITGLPVLVMDQLSERSMTITELVTVLGYTRSGVQDALHRLEEIDLVTSELLPGKVVQRRWRVRT